MPQGLQIRDASGNIVVDLTTRMGRYLGLASTGTTNGSISPPGANTGEIFMMVLPKAADFASRPQFTITSSSILWDWSGAPTWAPPTNTQFIYGVR